MRIGFQIILVIFLVVGVFIFIKGFQSNLGILEIITIFIAFMGFLIGFAILSASIAIFMNWISGVLVKK